MNALIAKAEPPSPEALSAADKAMAFVDKLAPIESYSDYLSASAKLTHAKQQRDRIEQMRVTLKKPFDEAGKTIQSWFKPVLEKWDYVIDSHKTRMLAYDGDVHKTPGISTRETWDYEVVNFDLVARKYLMVDEKKIRKIVQALGDAASIPGIKVIKVRSIAVLSGGEND